MALTKEERLERRRANNRRYMQAHPERVLESQKKYRERHPGRKEEQSKRFHAANPRKSWEYRIKWQYGMSVDEFNKKLEIQDHKCAICLKPFVDTPCVDHNHATKRNRDLLCRVCNRGLGLFDDSFVILDRAAQYLKKHEESNGIR